LWATILTGGAMETTVRAKIDQGTKQATTEVLSVLGLSFSDAIRLMLTSVASELAFSFNEARRYVLYGGELTDGGRDEMVCGGHVTAAHKVHRY